MRTRFNPNSLSFIVYEDNVRLHLVGWFNNPHLINSPKDILNLLKKLYISKSSLCVGRVFPFALISRLMTPLSW